MQKLIALILAVAGVFIFLESGSYFAIIPVILAILIYKGADHGAWFYIDPGSDSGSCHSDSSYSGCDGGGDGGGGD